jgi:hypothetical protein
MREVPVRLKIDGYNPVLIPDISASAILKLTCLHLAKGNRPLDVERSEKTTARTGKQKWSGTKKAIVWTLGLLVIGGGGYAAYRYSGDTEVDVPVARVAKRRL